MKIDWNEEIDRIMSLPIESGFKIVKLYAISMLNYRTEIGNRSNNLITELLGESNSGGFFYLCGFLSAGKITTKNLYRLGGF